MLFGAGTVSVLYLICLVVTAPGDNALKAFVVVKRLSLYTHWDVVLVSTNGT